MSILSSSSSQVDNNIRRRYASQDPIIEIPNENKIGYCKLHPTKKINGFCNDCNAPFCKNCMEDHIDHKIVSLRKFGEESKKSVLNQISIEGLSTQLEKKRSEVVREMEKLDENHRKANEVITLKENMMGENKTKIYEQELERLEAITQYLSWSEREASTVALKNACEKSLKNFNVEEKNQKRV